VTVEAITVVAGNVGVEQATQNALYTTELCGSKVPVFRGAAGPLARALEIADWFHGRDGLGDHGYAPTIRSAEPEHAANAITRIVRANPGIELVTLGPLTNLALAIQKEPAMVANVARCVVMGGAPCCEGNVTPAAEFNIWVDPEAAQIVFRSGLPIEMVGWQLSRGAAVFHLADIARLKALGSPWADFAVRSNSVAMEAYRRQTREIGISLPDPIAMGILLQPELCVEATTHRVEIEVHSPVTRGMSVVDRLNVGNDARNAEVWKDALPCSVCWRLDVGAWKELVFRSVA
jgi:purine nucleosidase